MCGVAFMSVDDGARWRNLLQIHYECSEYSGMVQFSDNKIDVNFDNGNAFHVNWKLCVCKTKTTNESFVLIELMQI